MPSRPIQILLVAAHPADSFDQAGGTLAHHVARGDKVTVAIATTGVRSHHWELKDEKQRQGSDLDVETRMKEAVAEKLEETRKACRICGFDDVRDLGFEDDDLLLDRAKVEAIAEVIREVKPDLLISHHPYETGGLKMHGTIGQATVFATTLAQGSGRGRQERHLTPSIYFMNPIAYIGANSLEYASTSRVDLYIDITDVIDKKVKALDCISSQYYGGAYSRKRGEMEDGHYGNKAGVGYAEAFQRYTPMVRYTLPISDKELDQVSEPMEHIMARRSEMIPAFLPLPDNMSFSSEHRIPPEKYND
jgi:LmbE family N-acetylglucosaminyl deacetylase